MSDQEPRLTSAVLVIKDGKYLLAERNKENYNGYWVKFPGSLEIDCLQVDKFVIPVMPEIYNMSYIKFVQTSSDIAPGDQNYFL